MRPSQAERLVAVARTYLGTPYRMGGISRKGVDCSGLTCLVYSELGMRLPRTARAQARVGRAVAGNSLAPGDLVFFSRRRGGRITHVGIFIGGNRFIHASPSAGAVRVDSLENRYFRERFVGARRVLRQEQLQALCGNQDS